MQSGTGRLSCSRTALKRCTSTETRWYKWLVSLVSPEIEEILRPRSLRSQMADALKTPRVSTALLVQTCDVQQCPRPRVLYLLASGRQWGSDIKTHSLGGTCSSHTGSELQLYCTVPILNSIKKFTQTVIQQKSPICGWWIVWFVLIKLITHANSHFAFKKTVI